MLVEKYREKLHFPVNFFSIFLLVTFIPDILHMDASFFKDAYWGAKVILACWVIYAGRSFLMRFTALEILYFTVAFIYLANLYVDIYFNLPPHKNKFTGNMDFLGFCLGIVIALSFRYDEGCRPEKSFWYFWATLAAGLAVAFFLAVENADFELLGTRYDANSTINTIMYGQTGCALALVSVFGIVNFNKKILRLLLFITFIIGVISIAKAGSRSPLVVLVLVSMFFFMARLGSIRGIIVISAILGLFIVFLQPILELLDSMGSSLGTRFNSMVEEGDTSGREYIYQNVLGIIKESPLFGSYYLIPSGIGSNGYPHNFFLEVFMATGFFGGVPFVILVLLTVIKAFQLIKARHPGSWMAIIYLQVICFGMFSTSLYASQEFWVLVFFIASVKLPAGDIPSRE